MILKKPKFWDYKKPNFFSYCLFPFTLIVELTNLIKKLKKPKEFKIKAICVGNIYIGGTGKTSLSIEINNILNKKKYKTCFVKKFYKNQIDEQKILENHGKLFLSKYRLNALQKAENENYQFAVCDDGLQDKGINYSTKIVCFNNVNWIGNGMIIPAGPLRENIKSLKTIDNVFLNGNLENINFLKDEIFKINPKILIHIGEYVPINLDEFDNTKKYLAFSGIGNHETFIAMLKKYGLTIVKDLEFGDHYEYKTEEINQIINEAKKLNCKIITTEKDYIRINNNNFNEIKFIKTKLKILDENKLLKSIV